MKTLFKVSTIVGALCFASSADAGYYGRQFNWNPYHPWHAWHAPRYYYQNNYSLGWRRGAGFGRCYYAERCGW
jgi:hypothetical protein